MKLDNISDKRIEKAIGEAERIVGSELTADLKKKLSNPDTIKQIISKLTLDDISKIESVMKNPSSASNILGKDETMKRIKTLLEG